MMSPTFYVKWLIAAIAVPSVGLGQIKPVFENATLQLNEAVIKPVRVQAPWRYEHSLGSRRFVVGGNDVSEVHPKTGKELWTLKSSDGASIRWLNAQGEIAYLADSKTTIRSLDLKDQRWIASLSLGSDLKDGTAIERLLVSDKAMVALSLTTVGTEDRNRKVTHYTLSWFEPGENEPKISKTFPWAGERPYSGGYLWSATRPDYAASAIHQLSWLGDNLLVSAGETQDLMCFEATSGKLLWQIPRVWEYERSFIGPSVWSHTMTRFGLDENVERIANGDLNFGDKKTQAEEEQKAKKHLTDAAKRFDEQTEASIVAGPIVVARPGADRWAPFNVFVAVVKGPKGVWSGYLADCVVYELSDQGFPVAMAKLPRMVQGQQFGRVPGGLVWPCQRGGLVRLSITELFQGIGPGMVDKVCRIDWYRELRPTARKVWLVADPIQGVAAFSANHMFETVSGGYVRTAKELVYRFPIALVDLVNGTHRELTVVVPLERQLPLPRTNVSVEDGMTHARGPYLLAITRMGFDDEGQLLSVVLGVEGSATRVDFDLNELLHQTEEAKKPDE